VMPTPASVRSRLVNALTAPCVPTGMNTGVSTDPWAVVSRPRRARPSRASSSKRNVIAAAILVRRRAAVPAGSRQASGVPVKKLRVGVIYGGRSGEHEVSVASAAAVFKNLDRKRYEPVAIRIDKDGRWALPSKAPALMSAADVIAASKSADDASQDGRETHLVGPP